MGGKVDLTYPRGLVGPPAFEEAGNQARRHQIRLDLRQFTITVVMQIEDLGFCGKGQGGKFVSEAI